MKEDFSVEQQQNCGPLITWHSLIIVMYEMCTLNQQLLLYLMNASGLPVYICKLAA